MHFVNNCPFFAEINEIGRKVQATQGTKGFTHRKKQLCGKKKAKTLDRILTEGGTDELQDEARER